MGVACDEGVGSVGGGAGERRRRSDFWRAGRRESRRRRIPAQIQDRADRHTARAGRGVHGGDAWPSDRAAGRVHHDAWSWRAQSHDRGGLRASGRDADDHADGPERHSVQPAGAVPDRRHDFGDAPDHQDGAPDRERRKHPDPGTRRIPRGDGRASGAGSARTSRGHRRRRDQSGADGTTA
jgi:hypothetical protein